MRFFLLSAFLAALASAQVPIPSRYDGFARGDPAAPLLWEIFGDLLCPGMPCPALLSCVASLLIV